MEIDEYQLYCLLKKGVTESAPFSKLPDVLVFKVLDKMFSATDISTFDGITLKCDPDELIAMKDRYESVVEPPYMNKKYWCQVLMDNSIKDEVIKEWIDNSYDQVVAGMTKKQKDLLLNL